MKDRFLRIAAGLIVLIFCLLPFCAFGEADSFGIDAPEEPVRPGTASVIIFRVPKAGACDITLEDEDGKTVSIAYLGYDASAGENAVYRNGTYNGEPAPAGEWRLTLKKDGQTARTAVTIADDTEDGLQTINTDETDGTDAEPPDKSNAETAESGSLSSEFVDEEIEEIIEDVFLEGEDDSGSEAREVVFTPSWTSPYEGRDTSRNYWTLPMDITDEEAVWSVLMSPITVLDNGKKNAEKTQVVIRSEPNEESDGVGVVTCMTQGVHVLERGEEWSLIECYSSSFHDSPILNWNALVQGYVPTKFLKEVQPATDYGIVIDKLTQRLYLFKDGHLFSTLLVSTGLSNERQPYNETRSGEFLLTSAVGTFASDNLRCAMALRFDDGDLLHEVPYILMKDGESRDYSICESKLGVKASHGCIRVQRKKTAEGINMGWLWDNRHKNTKLIIWEDWQGRQIPYPSDDTVLYYNPKGGQYYHTQDHCYSAVKKNTEFEPFKYGQLDDEPYSKLKRCEYCTPPLRKAEIDKINAEYVWGGDHDPVLTKARQDCPRKLKK